MGKSKKWIITGGAIAGLLLGLTGFKRLVEFLYPAQGYIGIIFIIMIVINFCRELKGPAPVRMGDSNEQ